MSDILIDTNIPTRIADPTNSHYQAAFDAVALLQAAGENLIVVPQTVYEFWALATRPIAANGLGFDAERCRQHIETMLNTFTLLPDQPTLLKVWLDLVTQYQCKGRAAYDARLVAAMRTHQLTLILTFNGPDFTRYPFLTIIDPFELVG